MSRFVPSIRASYMLLAVTLAIATVTAAVGQERFSTGNAAFQPDELVEIHVLGEWILGQVVKETADGSGSFRVKFHHEGKRFERSYPESRIRRKGEEPIFPLSDLRKWSDASGKHSVHARLLDVTEEDLAVFMKQDGNQIEVALDKLATPDRVYARKLAQQALVEADSQNNNWEGRGRVASTGRARRGALRVGAAGPIDNSDPGSAGPPAPPGGSHGSGHGSSHGSGAGSGHDARNGVAPADGLSDADLAEILGANEPNPTPGGESEMHGAAATAANENEPSADMLESLSGIGGTLFANENSTESGGEGATSGTFTLGDARSIVPDTTKGWELVPKSASASGWEDLVLDVPTFDGGAVVAMSLAVSRNGNRAVGQFQRDGDASVVAIASFAPQQDMTLVTTPELHRMLDINPTGDRMLGLAQPVDGNADWGIWTLQEGTTTRQATWNMPEVTAIHRAFWLDDDMAVVHVDDQVVLLNLDPAVTENVAYVVPEAKAMAVDSTRTYVAIQRDDGVLLLTAATGDQVGWIPAEGAPPTAVTFAPNGIYLAVATAESLIQVELESGSPMAVIPRPNAARQLDWLGSDYVVVDAAELIRLGTEVSVRSYSIESPLIPPTIQSREGAFWFLVPRDASGPAQFVRLGLIPTELEARQADPVTNWSFGRGGKSPLGGG